jgi:hypothetical protein
LNLQPQLLSLMRLRKESPRPVTKNKFIAKKWLWCCGISSTHRIWVLVDNMERGGGGLRLKATSETGGVQQ